MGIETRIAWADHTFSFWWGCVKLADGCKFCYAEALDNRWARGRHWGRKGPRRVAADSAWKSVLGWNRKALEEGRRRRIFPSMCDPFEAYEGPMVNAKGKLLPVTMEDVRRRGFELVDETPGLFWMLLTKRPENVCGMVPERWLESPPDNVMICASASDQETTVQMLGPLMDWPGYKGLSLEPLVGRVSFDRIDGIDEIDWVVIGGESGPEARECDVGNVDSLVGECVRACVPCYVKQLGSRPMMAVDDCRLVWPFGTEKRVHPGGAAVYRLKHGKGGDPAEWPAGLRVREYPGFMVEGIHHEVTKGRKDF